MGHCEDPKAFAACDPVTGCGGTFAFCRQCNVCKQLAEIWRGRAAYSSYTTPGIGMLDIL